ncbi:MAG: APC family permease [Desulfurococcales archaeon]|nr:APC family permease [Desulfurococcales archaeon]
MGGKEKMGLVEATAMAVGIIIGSSIFSLIGVGARIAGRDLPLAFALSSLAAAFVAYNYAKLGSTYVSNAGPIEFILRGLGDNLYTGVASFMLWFIYVSSVSLFAKTFAAYFLALTGYPLSPANMAVVESIVIAFFVALNFKGSKTVGMAETAIVAVKIGILLLFVVAGLFTINPGYLAPDLSVNGLKGALYAATLFFLSYTGFGLVTNASEDIRDPRRNVPRAIYLSLVIVTLIYIGVSIVAVGNMPIDELVSAEEYALAKAAEPFLGNLGFTLVSIGALVSVSSAINASIYGGANVAYSLAKKGELPPIFERKTWFNEPEGLYITALLGLAMAVALNLEGVAAVTSSSFIIIYMGVILAHYKLADETRGSRPIILLSFIIVASILAILLYSQYRNNPSSFYAIILSYAVAAIGEYLYRGRTRRSFKRRLQYWESQGSGESRY